MIPQPKVFKSREDFEENLELEEDFEASDESGVLDILSTPQSRNHRNKLSVSIEDLQAWLACGILPKLTYTYFVLLIKFDGNVNVDIKALSNCLSCAVAIDNEKIKPINFSEEETLSLVAKLNEKGALSIRQTAIQLHLNL